MKLTTHILGLLVVFSMFSLIGCSKDQNSQQAQAAAYQQGIQCGLSPQCGTAYLQRMGATPAQIAMAYPNGGLPQNSVGLMPPGTIPTTTTTPTTGAPTTIPVLPSINQQAAKIQKAIADISRNPNSSYYVDSSAEDVPARPSADQIAALTKALNSAPRAPASVENQQGNTASTQ